MQLLTSNEKGCEKAGEEYRRREEVLSLIPVKDARFQATDAEFFNWQTRHIRNYREDLKVLLDKVYCISTYFSKEVNMQKDMKELENFAKKYEETVGFSDQKEGTREYKIMRGEGEKKIKTEWKKVGRLAIYVITLSRQYILHIQGVRVGFCRWLRKYHEMKDDCQGRGLTSMVIIFSQTTLLVESLTRIRS